MRTPSKKGIYQTEVSAYFTLSTESLQSERIMNLSVKSFNFALLLNPSETRLSLANQVLVKYPLTE